MRSQQNNVHRQWLGIESDAEPDYYGLLGLSSFRVSPEQIQTALGDRLKVISRFRSGNETLYRDIERQLQEAAKALSDPEGKRHYDRALQRRRLVTPIKAETAIQRPIQHPRCASTSGIEAHTEEIQPASVEEPVRQYEELPGSDDQKRGTLDSHHRPYPESRNGESPGAAPLDRRGRDAVPTVTSSRKDKPSSRQAAYSVSEHPNYEILREIGSGESSIVYEAYDRILRRYVAIKQLDERFHMDRQESELFWKEARFLASIQHDHIVRVYAVDQSRRWIIMELLKSDLERQVHNTSLTADLVRSVLRQVLDGLDFLHQRDVLHGEVKLSNMLVDDQGRVKLSDSPGFSSEGEFRLPLGSHRHVAPELLASDEFGHLGPGVDLYPLGFAAIELLLGEPLENHLRGVCDGQNSNLAWMRWHSSSNESLPPIRDLLPDAPDDLVHVIERLVRKRASERYSSAAEVLRDLDEKPLLLFEPGEDQWELPSARVGSQTEASDSRASSHEEEGLQSLWIQFTSDSRRRWVAGASLAVAVLLLFILLASQGTGVDEERVAELPREPPVQGQQVDPFSRLEDSPPLIPEGPEPSPATGVNPSSKASYVQVSVDSVPSRGALWVDGKKSGPLPQDVRLEYGTCELRVTKNGFKEWREVMVVDDDTASLKIITLQPSPSPETVSQIAQSDSKIRPKATDSPQRPTSQGHATRRGRILRTEGIEPLGSSLTQSDRQDYYQSILKLVHAHGASDAHNAPDALSAVTLFQQAIALTAQDPRAYHALALYYDLEHNAAQARHYYEQAAARGSTPARRREIVLMLGALSRKDRDLALARCTQLVATVTGDSDNGFNNYESIRWENVKFTGNIFGYFKGLRETNQFLGDLEIPRDSVLASLQHMPEGAELVNLFEESEMATHSDYMRRWEAEEELTRHYKQEANRLWKQTTESEREIRSEVGPHEIKPPAPSYWRGGVEAGSGPRNLIANGSGTEQADGRYRSQGNLRTRDNESVKRTIVSHEATHSSAVKNSIRVVTYVSDNLELEKQRLLGTFPPAYRAKSTTLTSIY